MERKLVVQKPNVFLDLADFHVLLLALDAYLHSARQLTQSNGLYQDLSTKMEIAIATMDASHPKTLDLNHEELRLLLTALMEVNEALAAQEPERKASLKRYTHLMGGNVARIQGLLWAELLRANGGTKARLLN